MFKRSVVFALAISLLAPGGLAFSKGAEAEWHSCSNPPCDGSGNSFNDGSSTNNALVYAGVGLAVLLGGWLVWHVVKSRSDETPETTSLSSEPVSDMASNQETFPMTLTPVVQMSDDTGTSLDSVIVGGNLQLIQW